MMKCMRVIKRGALNEYIAIHPKASSPLNAWYDHVSMKSTDWKSFADVKKDYRLADKVGSCYVFNIGGNDYRLIVKISHVFVFIKKFMTHAEYNKNTWKTECGCDKPRPKKKSKAKSKIQQKKSKGKRK